MIVGVALKALAIVSTIGPTVWLFTGGPEATSVIGAPWLPLMVLVGWVCCGWLGRRWLAIPATCLLAAAAIGVAAVPSWDSGHIGWDGPAALGLLVPVVGLAVGLGVTLRKLSDLRLV